MKRYLIILSLITCTLALSSCNSLSPVSDTQVYYDIEEYLIPEETCGTCEYTIEHDLDKDARLDTVTVTVTYNWGYYIEECIGTYVYQHNQSTDLWTLYKPEEWVLHSSELVEDAYIGTWGGLIYDVSGIIESATFSINVTNVDFDDLSITCEYLIEYEGSTPPSISGNGTFALSYETNTTYRFEINDNGYQNSFIIGDGDLCGGSSYKAEFGHIALPHLYDWALLFSEKEASTLRNTASELSNRIGYDIEVVTVDSYTTFSEASPHQAARIIYNDLFSNTQCILLLLSASDAKSALFVSDDIITSEQEQKLRSSYSQDFSSFNFYEGLCNYLLAIDLIF